MQTHRDVAEVHTELKAAVLRWERAEQNVVMLFAEFVQAQHYRALGYPDIHSYAREELGFSKSRTSHFLSLVQAMQKMPALQEAVQKRELAWTKAAELARHATPESAAAWVHVAKQSTRAELRTQLIQARQPAIPQLALDPTAPAADPLPTMTDVRLRLNPLQLQRYERAMRRWRENGQDEVEAMLQALEGVSSNSEQLRRRNFPAALLVVHECPRCQTMVSQAAQGDRLLSAPQASAARCDSTIQQQGRRKQTIPPRLRRQALERDGYRCTTRDCRRAHDLQVHHLHERQHGGAHTLDNLVTLCGRCHESLHAGWRSVAPG